MNRAFLEGQYITSKTWPPSGTRQRRSHTTIKFTGDPVQREEIADELDSESLRFQMREESPAAVLVVGDPVVLVIPSWHWNHWDSFALKSVCPLLAEGII